MVSKCANGLRWQTYAHWNPNQSLQSWRTLTRLTSEIQSTRERKMPGRKNSWSMSKEQGPRVVCRLRKGAFPRGAHRRFLHLGWELETMTSSLPYFLILLSFIHRLSAKCHTPNSCQLISLRPVDVLLEQMKHQLSVVLMLERLFLWHIASFYT